MLAYVVVSTDLEPIVSANWHVHRVTDWDDSGLKFMAIEHEQAGVFDLVIGENGPWLKPDADV